jgi:hypothetical protein
MGFGKRCTRAAGLSIARRLPPAAEVRFDMMRARDIVLFTSRETGRFTYRAVVREKLESKLLFMASTRVQTERVRLAVQRRGGLEGVFSAVVAPSESSS